MLRSDVRTRQSVRGGRGIGAEAASIVESNLAALHSYPVADVAAIRFQRMTYEDMVKNSVVVVTEAAKNPGGSERNTPHDPRLGTIAMNGTCERCGMEAGSCSGHDAIILFHTYLAPQEKNLRTLLKQLCGMICAGCGRLILENDILRLRRAEADLTRDRTNESAWHFALVQTLYQESVGLGCHAKEDKASHANEVFFALEPKTEPFKTAAHLEGSTPKDKNASVLFPLEFYYEALERLTEEQLYYLGFAERGVVDGKTVYMVRAHPKALIEKAIPVIPICSRAPQAGESSTQTVFHPLTKGYNKIVTEANLVKAAKDRLEHEREQKRLGYRGATDDVMRELEISLQSQIDRLNAAVQENYEQNLKDVISSKKGLGRGELLGKITEQLGRAVVTPDPRNRPGEVSVPRKMASRVTVRVVVSPGNVAELTELLKKGSVKRIYPHTATIRGSTVQVTAANRSHLSLQIGDQIDRDLQVGDYLLFIRQPALSGLSVVAGRIARLWDYDVFGFSPEEVEMRAMDFDGDQVQGLAPQSMEAAAELASIGNLNQLMINVKDQSTVIGIHQDGVIGPVLMTSDPLGAEDPITPEKGWVTRALFDRITALTSDAAQTDISVEGKKLGLTTKLEDFKRRIELHGKFFSRMDGPVEVIPTDVLLSWAFPSDIQYKSPTVMIRDGIIIKGIVDKSVLGRQQDTLLHIMAETDRERAINTMKDVAIIGTSWLSFYGMSISLRDCTSVRQDAQRAIGMELARMMTELEGLVAPVDALDTRRYNTEWEAIVAATTGRIDELVQGGLDPNNRIAKMLIGKGSTKHLNSIAAIIGQQYIAGRLPVPSVTEGTRYSWWFDENDREPTNQGMCTSNLGDGITPAEAIHAAAAARISITNLNVTTPDIGKKFNEMSRVLQGVITTPAASCTDGVLITTALYGGDGMTGDRLARKRQPGGHLEVRFCDLQAFTDTLNAEAGWYRT